jgi:glycosyltransferase involved in cell wall biosynthesis
LLKKVKMKAETVSIVIPAHNEECRIEKTLESYLDFFKKKKKLKEIKDFEIIVVSNACKDNTFEVVNKIKKTNKELRILDFEKGGKGFAVTQGFRDALKRDNDLIGFVDADNATQAEAYFDLIKNIGKYDGIIASRYLKGAVMEPKQGLKRRFISRAGNLYIRTLLLIPFKDTQCGAKIFKKEALKKIIDNLGMSQWGFDVEILYKLKKKGCRVKEHPTSWRDVVGSKLNMKKAGSQALLAVTHLRISHSPFKNTLKPAKPIIAHIWRKFSK